MRRAQSRAEGRDVGESSTHALSPGSPRRRRRLAGFSVEQLAAIDGGKLEAGWSARRSGLMRRSPSESDTRAPCASLSLATDARGRSAASARTGMLVAANDLANGGPAAGTPASASVSTNLCLGCEPAAACAERRDRARRRGADAGEFGAMAAIPTPKALPSSAAQTVGAGGGGGRFLGVSVLPRRPAVAAASICARLPRPAPSQP